MGPKGPLYMGPVGSHIWPEATCPLQELELDPSPIICLSLLIYSSTFANGNSYLTMHLAVVQWTQTIIVVLLYWIINIFPSM